MHILYIIYYSYIFKSRTIRRATRSEELLNLLPTLEPKASTIISEFLYRRPALPFHSATFSLVQPI